MSNERLLQIKQACERWHSFAPGDAAVLLGEALNEIDRLKLGLKVGDRLRGGAWQILRERVAAARGVCADNPKHTDSIDELLAFIDGTGWAERAPVDTHREGFLREAIIALGAEVEWRASAHGTGVYIATEREPKECAQRAIKLWAAYCNIHRGKP